MTRVREDGAHEHQEPRETGLVGFICSVCSVRGLRKNYLEIEL